MANFYALTTNNEKKIRQNGNRNYGTEVVPQCTYSAASRTCAPNYGTVVITGHTCSDACCTTHYGALGVFFIQILI
jgi:hypothetical protein